MNAETGTAMDAFWMPFTASRQFRKQPRMLERAQGMFYTTPDGREVLDATSGLWCCNLGHGRPEIVAAIANQAAKMDYAPAYQMGHPIAFELAERLALMTPGNLNKVFFTNSGSEAVDTAMKVALAYHHARGETRNLFVGRELGYHGTGFGGMSVGGMPNNKKQFGPGVDAVHLPHTLLPENAFSRGLPTLGTDRAEALHDIVNQHGASNIAAVIVEPIAGSGGVIVPPAGYLERLAEICQQHGLLLIFDEVITGFGRLGSSFASVEFGVTPDIMAVAKGITNGAVPMGAAIVSDNIHDTIVNGPQETIEFFHGYTYSGHPLAAAAALAALDLYRDEQVFENVAALKATFEDSVHALANCRHVTDIRNYGFMAAVQLEPHPDGPGKRGLEVLNTCFFDHNLMVRMSGDVIAIAPPLVINENQIKHVFSTLGEVVNGIN